MPSAVAKFTLTGTPGEEDRVTVNTAFAVPASPSATEMSLIVRNGVGPGCTTCVMGADVLPAMPVSPLYSAVKEWLPTLSVAVVSTACPDPFTGEVPSVVTPSLNVTVPVGTRGSCTSDTVAVRVTVLPYPEGFGLLMRVVVEDSVPSVTAMVTVAELESGVPALSVTVTVSANDGVASKSTAVLLATVIWPVLAPIAKAPPVLPAVMA